MNTHETELLADFIARKRDCLTQLRDLGSRQLELIEGGDLTGLIKVLSAKTHLIGVLQKIENDLKPFHSEDPKERKWRLPEDRARCADDAAACQELLGEIVKQEQQSESRLKDRRDEAGVQLHDAHAAGRARGAYFDQSGPRSGTLDVTSHLGGAQ